MKLEDAKKLARVLAQVQEEHGPKRAAQLAEQVNAFQQKLQANPGGERKLPGFVQQVIKQVNLKLPLREPLEETSGKPGRGEQTALDATVRKPLPPLPGKPPQLKPLPPLPPASDSQVKTAMEGATPRPPKPPRRIPQSPLSATQKLDMARTTRYQPRDERPNSLAWQEREESAGGLAAAPQPSERQPLPETPPTWVVNQSLPEAPSMREPNQPLPSTEALTPSAPVALPRAPAPEPRTALELPQAPSIRVRQMPPAQQTTPAKPIPRTAPPGTPAPGQRQPLPQQQAPLPQRTEPRLGQTEERQTRLPRPGLPVADPRATMMTARPLPMPLPNASPTNSIPGMGGMGEVVGVLGQILSALRQPATGQTPKSNLPTAQRQPPIGVPDVRQSEPRLDREKMQKDRR